MPPYGTAAGASRGDLSAGGESAPNAPSDGAERSSGTERKVEETDLYRLEGDRLYYLNAYRGLMVFDVSDVDAPKLLGRSAIFGWPVEMIVRGGIATVVVADWYGTMDDGTPFHGSIVRGLDARNPGAIKVLGEAKLGGWVRDTRVVGDVLYAVSEDYGWAYGYSGEVAERDTVSSPARGRNAVMSSVSFANGVIAQKAEERFEGYASVFNVTDTAIMMAHDIPSDPNQPYSTPSGRSELVYIDITDPGGAIALRGRAEVRGSLQAWGTDAGRWNLDFADKRYAHLLSCAGSYCGANDSGYILSTVDFGNPNAPVKASELTVPSTGWSVATRFDGARMYLSPGSDYAGSGTTPVKIYDLSNPAVPALAGETSVQGPIWNFTPAGDRLFALGSDNSENSSRVKVQYLDVSDATAPSLIGSSSFGDGWAWTPAAGTFKAFAKNDAQGLVALPFSGWSNQEQEYRNGVQLIEFTPTAIRTAGAARARGWVERGIFVQSGGKARVISLSDQALSVIDYTDRNAPRVVREVTLARNVVNARPEGANVAELSSDWWGYDQRQTELRMLPIGNADEHSDASGVPTAKIDGINARAFRNGSFTYVVTNVKTEVPCATKPGMGSGADAIGPRPGGESGPSKCYAYVPQVQVVDFASGAAVLKGKVSLPVDQAYSGYGYGWGWGWFGCFAYDWYHGDDVVQVDGDALAFRRYEPVYREDGTWEANQTLYVVDLRNADAPSLASTLVTTDKQSWWGNMRAVGGKLYTSHYEWKVLPKYNPNGFSSPGRVRYYLDQIDLSDRQNPRVGAKINVPGILVGASETDASILYFVDYRWYGDRARDDLAIAQIRGDRAYLQSALPIEGWMGNVFVRGNKAYATVQRYEEQSGEARPSGPRMSLHEFDITDPRRPVDRAANERGGWGWLLGIEGDRAVITSGWGNEGIDVYRLRDGGAPAYDQFVRTRGWGGTLSRQDDTLFLASGFWGVQSISLR